MRPVPDCAGSVFRNWRVECWLTSPDPPAKPMPLSGIEPDRCQSWGRDGSWTPIHPVNVVPGGDDSIDNVAHVALAILSANIAQLQWPVYSNKAPKVFGVRPCGWPAAYSRK